MPKELNGRPAVSFTWTISERQFAVIQNTDDGEKLMAVSSSMDTFLKCMSDMMRAAGKDCLFQVVPKAGETGTVQ